ncbi:SGMS1 [Cordylochernes scorpioides]|uniref:SGMS1 n=1 Tax=Cordylochernes scorpioides TaxID=51811 RepID=A0ABY6KAJ4_9ARAC|nr:SGMS1 [Cordylochernes scorpioides]
MNGSPSGGPSGAVPKIHFHVNSLHQALLKPPEGAAETVVTLTGPSERLPPEPCKTFLAFVALSAALIANLATLAVIHDLVPASTPPLPDVMFRLVPELPACLTAAEVVLLLLSWSTAIVLAFHRHRSVSRRGVGGMRSAVLDCPIHAQWDLGLEIELANSSEQLHGFGEKCRPHQPYEPDEIPEIWLKRIPTEANVLWSGLESSWAVAQHSIFYGKEP